MHHAIPILLAVSQSKLHRLQSVQAGRTVAKSTSALHLASPTASWKAGKDFLGDFNRLERAINLSNSERNGIFEKRRRILEAIPKQRTIWKTFLREKVQPQLAGATLMGLVVRNLAPVRKICERISQVQFFSLLVVFPLIMVLTTRLRSNLCGEDIAKQDPVYRLFIQWSTVVMGSLVAPLTLSAPRRLIVRLAVACSLHQFPRLYYDATHSDRPVTWLSHQLESALPMVLSSWWIAWELGLCGLAPVQYLRMGAATALLEQFPSAFVVRGTLIKSMLMGGLGRVLYKNRSNLSDFFKRLQTVAESVGITRLLANALRLPITGYCWVLGLQLLAPLIHIRTFSNVIRLQNSSPNLSLASGDPQEIQRALQEPPQWQVSLEWREPERISTVLDDWSSELLHTFLFAGSVEEQLFQSRMKMLEDEVMQVRETWDAKDLVNITVLKEQAMERMVRQHEYEYEHGNGTYTDPLGVAVYRTLGIGLGFNYDHFNDTASLPETRLWQSRSAKSAVARIQKLKRRKAKKLSECADDAERARLEAELDIKIKYEVDYFAERLSNLIPTDMGLPNDEGTQMQEFDTNSYTKVAGNEIVVQSPTIESVMGNSYRSENWESSFLNPFHDTPFPNGTATDETHESGSEDLTEADEDHDEPREYLV